MLRKSLLLAVAAVLVLAASAPAATTSFKVPFSRIDEIECVPPDLVLLEGTLHIVEGVTVDRNGGLHGHISLQSQGITGVSLLNGTVFRVVGGTRLIVGLDGETAPLIGTFVNSYRLIAPGPNNNFQVQETYHLTVDATGNVRVLLIKAEVRCNA